MHRDFSPAPPGFIPGSRQETTAAEEEPRGPPAPCAAPGALYEIYRTSREKVESYEFIKIYDQRAKPRDLMRLPKER